MGYDSTMQYNVGAQDRLLQDPSNSLFVHPGYTKTSLAQQSISDLRPVQDSKYFGNVVKWNIPQMADLLGPIDLMLELNEAMTKKSGDADTTYDDTYVGWVETMGYAMIDYATLSIGQNEIERITGDQMHMMNELMSSDKGKQVQTVGTTGRSLVALRGDQVPIKDNTHARTEYKWRNKHYKSPRLVLDEGKACPGMKLCVPLPFFFTKGPQDYLPLAMFSGCQNVTIEVRLRPIEELLIRGCYRYNPDVVSSYHSGGKKLRVNAKHNIHQEYYHRGDYMPQRDLLNSSDDHGDNRAKLISALIARVDCPQPAARPAHRVPPLFATLGRTRTSSTSRSAGTPPASRTCTNCLRCAPSHMPRALKSPQSRAFCPRGTAHTTRRAASRLRGPRTARTAPCVHCLRPSAERVQVQPAAQLGHLPRHGHGVDVWRALLPAPCPPISAVAPSPLHTHAVRAHTALARCLPPPAARAARPAPCALCASDRFGRERTSSTSL